ELSYAAFNGDRVVTSFPRHDIVKLDDETYIQWQQQVRLALDGYDLIRFLDGTLPLSSQFIQTPDRSLAPNSSAQVFKQQDRLLTSWLLSTISAFLLPSFTDARSAFDVWTTATDLFAADIGAKQSRLCHELHSLKKVNALVECESRQSHAIQDIYLHANLVESVPSQVAEDSVCGGWLSPRRRGRTFQPRLQCQICNASGILPNGATIVTIESTDLPVPLYVCGMDVSHGERVGDEWMFPQVKSLRFSYYPQIGQNQLYDGQNQNYGVAGPYTGMSSLLMGDGTPARISAIGNGVLPTPSKLLHLSSVLCVLNIRKNLLSVSQFANDNVVFFEFHPTYCVINDIKTKETLLTGHIRDDCITFQY
ncbi:hypothetical protein J1N35_023479, partial [Gossypium stocksii]